MGGRLSDFGDVLANLATTSRAMDKWMLQLDSAAQKGPEISLEGILIVVEGCVTAEVNGSSLTKTNTTLAPAFLHISRKLLSSLLAEQHVVYCYSLSGLCIRKCGNGPGQADHNSKIQYIRYIQLYSAKIPLYF